MYKCESYNYILFYLSNLFIKKSTKYFGANMWRQNVCDIESLSIVSVVDVCFIYYQTLKKSVVKYAKKFSFNHFQKSTQSNGAAKLTFFNSKSKSGTNQQTGSYHWLPINSASQSHANGTIQGVLKLRACSKYLNIEFLCANIFETSWIYVSSRVYSVLSIASCKLFRNTLY